MNVVLLEMLDKSSDFPRTTEKIKKLRELTMQLFELITEKLELWKSIESKHETLNTIYKENKAEVESVNIGISPSVEAEKELQLAQDERDKALGLVKILLATLKSSRMQSEENFHKLKYSSDLLFHIMYKAEDAFLEAEN